MRHIGGEELILDKGTGGTTNSNVDKPTAATMLSPADPDSTLTSKQVAVIQAGTAGIGLSIAERLLADGFAVVLSSRRAENVDAAVKELGGAEAGVFGVVGHAGVNDDRKDLADVACGLRADGKVS
jgi:hypothetical protein